MLVPLSSVSLSHSTRPKFTVLFPCIARAESVIATILYCNTVYNTAVDCFAVYYCSIYIFLEVEEHLRILFTDTGMPRSRKFTLAFNWTGVYNRPKFLNRGKTLPGAYISRY